MPQYSPPHLPGLLPEPHAPEAPQLQHVQLELQVLPRLELAWAALPAAPGAGAGTGDGDGTGDGGVTDCNGAGEGAGAGGAAAGSGEPELPCLWLNWEAPLADVQPLLLPPEPLPVSDCCCALHLLAVHAGMLLSRLCRSLAPVMKVTMRGMECGARSF